LVVSSLQIAYSKSVTGVHPTKEAVTIFFRRVARVREYDANVNSFFQITLIFYLLFFAIVYFLYKSCQKRGDWHDMGAILRNMDFIT
jgi:hypothetical protein